MMTIWYEQLKLSPQKQIPIFNPYVHSNISVSSSSTIYVLNTMHKTSSNV